MCITKPSHIADGPFAFVPFYFAISIGPPRAAPLRSVAEVQFPTFSSRALDCPIDIDDRTTYLAMGTCTLAARSHRGAIRTRTDEYA